VTTFLIFDINSKKEVTMREIDIPDELDGQEVRLEETLKHNINPPFSGKTLVVEKDKIRTFRLRTEVVET